MNTTRGNMTTVLGLFIVLPVFLLEVHCTETDTTCITPNNETATCISFFSCPVIRDSPYHSNRDFLEFIQQSKSVCKSETDQWLVCCGSTGFVPEPIKERPKVNLDVVLVNQLPNRTVCGVERELQRIKGGTETYIDEFPWMALIRYVHKDTKKDEGFKCGGTLINNKFVLTAAHCIITDPQQFQVDSVRLGEWQISSEEDCVTALAVERCADPVVDVKVEALIPHSYYDISTGNNDIGLLFLKEAVRYSDFIRPICLPPANLPAPPAGYVMTVCGWGATENGEPSDRKLKLKVPVVSNTDCRRYITGYTKISLNQICAGGRLGEDTCQGDSGGPLMRTYTDETSQWYQEGIVSRGLGCGREGVPGIYTRISRYSAWIINNIADY